MGQAPAIIVNMGRKRVTIMIDDELLKQAQRKAADEGISLSALIEDALKDRISRERRVENVKKHYAFVDTPLQP